MNSPRSCDTFVVLPPLTRDGAVVFGKNSDRPQGEVQEVVYFKDRECASRLKCTYITIRESTEPINAVILSKPAWMWGAEMGSNDKNVVIGNEAVSTNFDQASGDARVKRLLGMDLVRLGLERGKTSLDALKVITTLLETYGQGGPCSEHDRTLYYHNSFLIADPKEAWVLETSGKFWAAEKVEAGYRNISNGLTIKTKIDICSAGLKEKAKSLGFWGGKGDFNFTECFSAGGDEKRQKKGEMLLNTLSQSRSFDINDMLKILRSKESDICRSCDEAFPTQGSQISVLCDTFNVHWFTSTPDPSMSLYKPFVFGPNVKISVHTKSPDSFSREHHLYEMHMKHCLRKYFDHKILQRLNYLERQSIKDIDNIKALYEAASGRDSPSLKILDNIMEVSVDNELKLYSKQF